MLEIFDKELMKTFNKRPKVSDQWLHYQRNKLMGAIDQIENRKGSWFPIQLFAFKPQEAPISFAIFGIFTLLIGFSVGIFTNPFHPFQSEKSTNNIMELLTSNKISSVQLDIDQNQSEPYAFKFVSQNDYQYSGSENDQTVILLLEHMLNNTANPGDRLKLARKLSDTGVNSEMAVSVIIKAMLSEDNSAIQSVLIESLQHNESLTVRDALLQIVMGEYDAPIRMSALNYLEHFSADPYVHQILKVISISDENPSVRYTAGKLLMSSTDITETTGEIKK